MTIHDGANQELRSLMRVLSVTRKELARVTGVAQSTIYRRFLTELPREDKALYKTLIEQISEAKSKGVIG